jgi:hypothetical protein
MKQATILAGTSKGLVVFWLDGKSIVKTDVHFRGFPVSMIFVDEKKQTWWVALSHKHWGEKLHFSTDFGQSWQLAGLPSFTGFEYKPNVPASLKKIWVMERSTKNHDSFWLGTEPGGLFFSNDGGKTFQLNKPLWNHPSRLDDKQWFGTGKDYPFIHTVIIDPRDSNHIYVGVSCAGVFETIDGGKSWTPRNNGLIAAYLPKTTPEVGHDPHQMLSCASNPDVIWQQNHCGIFRTTNGGKNWISLNQLSPLSAGEGRGVRPWPHYGFALAIDETNPDAAWVIPAESDEARVPLDLKLQVCKTIDGGKTWQSQTNGLPQENSFDLVLRHGLVRKQELMSFGTTNGNLYCSFNDGEHWETLSTNLAPICVVAIHEKEKGID